MYICIYIYIYICVFDFVYRFFYLSSLSFSHFLYLSTFIHFFVRFSLFFEAKRKPRGKYNVTANRTKIAEDMQVHEVCLFGPCFFVISLLYYMLINHLLTSCSFCFLFFFFIITYPGRGRCTRRLFYKCRGEFYSKQMGTVL